MNELKELHLRGELSEKGYLKETYDNSTNDLKHELTGLGRAEIRELFKDVSYRRLFMEMALEEAKKHPNEAQTIIKNAIEKTRELMS